MTVHFDGPIEHEHEWERGIHMAEAFGVDGRKYACAICGLPKPETGGGAHRPKPRSEAGTTDEGTFTPTRPGPSLVSA